MQCIFGIPEAWWSSLGRNKTYVPEILSKTASTYYALLMFQFQVVPRFWLIQFGKCFSWTLRSQCILMGGLIVDVCCDYLNSYVPLLFSYCLSSEVYPKYFLSFISAVSSCLELAKNLLFLNPPHCSNPKKVLNENDTPQFFWFPFVYTLKRQNWSFLTKSVDIHFQVVFHRSNSSWKGQF